LPYLVVHIQLQYIYELHGMALYSRKHIKLWLTLNLWYIIVAAIVTPLENFFTYGTWWYDVNKAWMYLFISPDIFFLSLLSHSNRVSFCLFLYFPSFSLSLSASLCLSLFLYIHFIYFYIFVKLYQPFFANWISI